MSNPLDVGIDSVIADTFYFISLLFHQKISVKDPLPFENSKIIRIALWIIEKNTARMTFSKEHDEIKRNLNISIITLLLNLSGYPAYINVFDNSDYVYIVKKILKNEYKGSQNNFINSSRTLFPLNIEKCHFMWNVENIKILLQGEDGLAPYNYISLRIMMHLADVLSNVPFVTFDIYKSEENNIIEGLKKQSVDSLIKFERERLSLERMNFREYKIRVKAKFLYLYNTPEIRINEVIKVSEVSSNHNKFVENFLFFLEWLNGDDSSGELSQIFQKQKYDPKLVKLDRISFFSKENDKVQSLIKILNEEIFKRTFTAFIASSYSLL